MGCGSGIGKDNGAAGPVNIVATAMSGQDANLPERWTALSREMVALAKANEWEQLARCEAERDQQIRSYFASPVSATDMERVRFSVQQVLELDETVRRLAEQARDEVARSLVELRRGSHAVQAYSDQTRHSQDRD